MRQIRNSQLNAQGDRQHVNAFNLPNTKSGRFSNLWGSNLNIETQR